MQRQEAAVCPVPVRHVNEFHRREGRRNYWMPLQELLTLRAMGAHAQQEDILLRLCRGQDPTNHQFFLSPSSPTHHHHPSVPNVWSINYPQASLLICNINSVAPTFHCLQAS